MAKSERRLKIPLPDGTIMEGTEVEVIDSKEPWNEYRLEDGTILRLKNIAVSIIRTDGYDQERNPVYVVKAAQAITVVETPEQLRKKI